jgi:hypothetical protein
LEAVTDSLGRDAGECQRGLELGIGLGLRFDEAMDVCFQLRAAFFGLLASAEAASVQAADAGPLLVEPGFDSGASPAKGGFGGSRGAITILQSHFGLELPAFVAGKKFSSRLDGLDDVVRESFHGRLLLETAGL